jgi:hypothetical protein
MFPVTPPAPEAAKLIAGKRALEIVPLDMLAAFVVSVEHDAATPDKAAQR